MMGGGRLKIGSAFACMAKLPPTIWEKIGDLEEQKMQLLCAEK